MKFLIKLFGGYTKDELTALELTITNLKKDMDALLEANEGLAEDVVEYLDEIEELKAHKCPTVNMDTEEGETLPYDYVQADWRERRFEITEDCYNDLVALNDGTVPKVIPGTDHQVSYNEIVGQRKSLLSVWNEYFLNTSRDGKRSHAEFNDYLNTSPFAERLNDVSNPEVHDILFEVFVEKE